MPSPRRRRRSPARWIAPLLLVVAGVAVYTVVHPSSTKDKTATTGTERTRTSTARTTTRPRRAPKPRPRTYTVKAGDTLSAIAGKTGVSLARIEALNPKLDAGALQTGETIKLGP